MLLTLFRNNIAYFIEVSVISFIIYALFGFVYRQERNSELITLLTTCFVLLYLIMHVK